MPGDIRRLYDDITKTVGRTPLVRLNRITEGARAAVLVKLESFNPLSSIKDRIIPSEPPAGRPRSIDEAPLSVATLPRGWHPVSRHALHATIGNRARPRHAYER